MKKIVSLLALAILVLSLQACGDSSNINKLDGKWACDIKDSANLVSNGVEIDEALLAQLVGIFKDMTITFNTSQKEMTLFMAGNSETAKFTVESEKDDVFVLLVDGQKIIVSLKKNANGNDMITMSVPGQPIQATLAFVRVK